MTRLAVVWAVTAVFSTVTGAMAAEKTGPAKGPLATHSSHAAKPAPAAKSEPAPVPAPAPEAKPDSADDVSKGDEGSGSDDSGSEGRGDAKGAPAGLPIPRFASLSTNPVNLRTGPGVRYPVDWVYVRRHLPVEVIGEFDTWRHIRDPDGTEGWVHQRMLSGKRTAVVSGEARTLRRTGEDTADVIATLEPGVIVNVQRCPAEAGYCRVEVNGIQGWLKREQFWGVYSDETVQ